MTWNRFLRGSCWFGMEQNWSHAKLDGTESHCDPLLLIKFGNWVILDYQIDNFEDFLPQTNSNQKFIHYMFLAFSIEKVYFEVSTHLCHVYTGKSSSNFEFHKKTFCWLVILDVIKWVDVSK